MPMIAMSTDGGFDSETTRILGAAFEAAWTKLEASGVLTDATGVTSARDRLAKRLIELARRGERDPDRLVAESLGHLLTPQPVSGLWISTSGRG